MRRLICDFIKGLALAAEPGRLGTGEPPPIVRRSCALAAAAAGNRAAFLPPRDVVLKDI